MGLTHLWNLMCNMMYIVQSSNFTIETNSIPALCHYYVSGKVHKGFPIVNKRWDIWFIYTCYFYFSNIKLAIFGFYFIVIRIAQATSLISEICINLFFLVLILLSTSNWISFRQHKTKSNYLFSLISPYWFPEIFVNKPAIRHLHALIYFLGCFDLFYFRIYKIIPNLFSWRWMKSYLWDI